MVISREPATAVAVAIRLRATVLQMPPVRLRPI